MKIRKFVAGSMPEAMNLVKRELGRDAVILYTKNIKKKGFLKWFNKEGIEVVAALDGESTIEPNDLNGMLPKGNIPVVPPFDHIESPKPVSYEPQNTIPIRETAVRETNEWAGSLPSELKNVSERLLREGIRPNLANQLIQGLLKRWYTAEEPLSKEAIKKALKELLLNDLNDLNFSGLTYQSKVLNLVGPTGVGKTTTAAKLASKAALDDEKSVAFITIDTYRIAAVEQLKTYAKILNLPVEVAYSADDFRQALTTFKDKDLIIVDSAGRNFQQKKFVNELKSFIPFDQGMDTYLVLSATAKSSDLERISGQFSEVPITQYVFTKVDETASIGSLFNLLFDKGIGVSYITNGQNVPDDLVEADKEALVRQLIEGVFND